jgi:uncharacterized protein (TIGR02588 family)
MSPRARAGRHVAEVVTLVVSIAVVALLVAGVLYVQVARGDRLPAIDVTVSLETVRADGERFYLPVKIENTGDQAAEAVRVIVLQRVGERELEHELLIDYLAGRGSADATAVLTRDPRQAEVRVEVRSFLRK